MHTTPPYNRYVEPAAVVEPTNELKAAQVALKVEEQRIYRDMTLLVRKSLPAITQALEAAAQVKRAHSSNARMGFPGGLLLAGNRWDVCVVRPC